MKNLTLDASDVYKELRLRGYEYGPKFQGIIGADVEVGDLDSQKHGYGENGLQDSHEPPRQNSTETFSRDYLRNDSSRSSNFL
ncbi:hypothetical protein TNCV_1947201 [Trichonephila clavipes]|nr:hypothetical protein TNCV_1947201 [Trichonephila clavipes]